MLHFIIIPLISAFIGYLTNVIAIKLLFWPKKPINLIFFTLQGLLPKRQADIANSVGALVEEQLLSMDELMDRIDNPDMHLKIADKLAEIARNKIDTVLPGILPGKITRLITDNLERMLRQEAPGLIRQVMASGRDYLTAEVDIKKMVEDKINSFDLDQLEAMIKNVSSPEIRFIEILGGVLGLLIGLIQVLFLLLFPFSV
ncbi:Protein of unknown function [Thermosyntropha lipolytica DSM 11003]|uniref:DUF445 domain-containing protein n=1 Tax=Thermosyntropha lipolytica DSM 11003 TaxID=1123382 RepID=A0A1M5K491_9FIRM|nr:DUF445 family protein [Thermosyntropha lipolytica]SHG47575.1 Protein of unknown function [Thermosyntropha lipolytica DSM 11003]